MKRPASPLSALIAGAPAGAGFGAGLIGADAGDLGALAAADPATLAIFLLGAAIAFYPVVIATVFCAAIRP